MRPCRSHTLARRRGRPLHVEALEDRRLLATIAVTNTNHAGPGSLRAAIEAANLDPGGDTIAFDAAVRGAIVLSGALPELSGALELAGPGAAALTVARSPAPGTPEFRIFTVAAGADVAISGLSITGGHVGLGLAGGGILNEGTLAVTSSVLTGNSAQRAGGGIANNGIMTVTTSTLSGNSSAQLGGGISNHGGTVTVTDSTFTANSAEGGGGIFSSRGTMTVTGSTLAGNTARFDGGGIDNFVGELTVTSSTLTGNSAEFNGGGIFNNAGTVTVIGSALTANTAEFNGGGIDNTGIMTVTTSTLSGNSAGTSGGAISGGGTLTVTDSTISGNSAGISGTHEGGGIFNRLGTVAVTRSTLAGNSAGGSGGGIANHGGTVTVTDSTLAGNSAGGSGGGLFSDPFRSPGVPRLQIPERIFGSTLMVTTSTLSGNSAGTSGGGISSGGTLTVTASTLTANSARGGVGADLSNSAGLEVFRGTASLLSSIFASTAGGSVADATGLVTSLGHNLFAAAPALSLQSTDRVSTDPRLGPLADNGGPTFTHALLPGSSALDAGAAVAGLTTDQRGIPRPQGGSPDIGAFELAVPMAPAPTVLALRRIGSHARPTALVLTFSTPLDPTRAQDLGNYRLSVPGRPRRTIRVRAARYDAAANAVTLEPARRLPLSRRFVLTVDGTPPDGLAGTSGVPLDGSGSGRPGSDLVARFGPEALAGPSGTASREARDGRAGPRPSGGPHWRLPPTGSPRSTSPPAPAPR